ncbi:hypothetical protein WME73_05520 [Sorangium sp. So ce302]
MDDLDLAAFMCVKTVETLTHTAVVNDGAYVAGPRMKTFLDETTRLVAG